MYKISIQNYNLSVSQSTQNTIFWLCKQITFNVWSCYNFKLTRLTSCRFLWFLFNVYWKRYLWGVVKNMSEVSETAFLKFRSLSPIFEIKNNSSLFCFSLVFSIWDKKILRRNEWTWILCGDCKCLVGWIIGFCSKFKVY